MREVFIDPKQQRFIDDNPDMPEVKEFLASEDDPIFIQQQKLQEMCNKIPASYYEEDPPSVQ